MNHKSQAPRKPLLVTVTAILPLNSLFSPNSLETNTMNLNANTRGSTPIDISDNDVPVMSSHGASATRTVATSSTRTNNVGVSFKTGPGPGPGPVDTDSSRLMQGYVKVQAMADDNTSDGLGGPTSSDSSAASASSLSSDTEDPSCSPTDTMFSEDESLETNIAFLKEKQGLLQRFSAELLQDELYQATAARKDIAIQKEEEFDSLSSTSFTLSDDEDDEDFLNSGVSIWVRAKKVLRSLSRHRGVLYHPASHSNVIGVKAESKKRPATSDLQDKAKNNKKQRRVRFGPEVTGSDDHDESSQSSSASHENDLERASRCARKIIDRSPKGVRRVSSAVFGLHGNPSKNDDSSHPDAVSCVSTYSGSANREETDAFMLSLQSVLVDPKPISFPPISIPYQTAG